MAGLIAPTTLEQIRAASDIVDVIGAYVPLKRAGANFTALCPFHREKSPSFNVNPHKQIYYCFGCHKGGDVFSFVKEYENITFVDAVKRLAERANIALEFDNNPGAQQAKHLKESLWQIHEQICQRWQACLANEAAGQLARDYLQKRGVSEEAVKLFRLGAAPDAWDDTVNWAKSKGHDIGLMEQSGLIVKKEETGRHYDRFRGRLMFPICDEQARVIGFSGRILAGDEKTAKYVNSPETPIFSKGKVFFGLDKSKRALLDAGVAVVCEGQLDLIACYMGGVQNIVAPQGTALTADHARILKRYVEEVVLCFDADNAGQNAAVRSLDSLLSAGLAIRVASVPSGKDPDQFIKESGGPAFQQLIEGAEGFFDFYLKRLCATNDPATDRGRLAVLREFGEALHKTRNAVLIDKYAQKTALRLGVSAEAVRAEFKKATKPVEEREADEPMPEEESVAPPSPHEEQLLKLLLAGDEHVEWIAAHLQTDWLSHPIARRIITRRLDAQSSGRWPGAAAFLSEFQDDPAAQQLLSRTLADSRKIPNPEQQCADIVLSLRNQSISREMAALTQRLSQPEAGDAERAELFARQQRLRRQRSAPLVPLADEL